MDRRLINTALGIVAALTAFGGSGKATPFMTFGVGGGTPGGAFKVSSSASGGLFDVTSTGWTAPTFFTLQLLGATDSQTDSLTHFNGTTQVAGATLDWNSTTNQLTLDGCVTGLTGISNCSSANNILLTLSFGTGANALGSTTNPGTSGSSAQVLFTAATSLSANSTLLADLYLAAPVQSTGNGITGNWASNGVSPSTSTYNDVSYQLSMNVSQTPEPMSFLLMGRALLALGCFWRVKPLASK